MTNKEIFQAAIVVAFFLGVLSACFFMWMVMRIAGVTS